MPIGIWKRISTEISDSEKKLQVLAGADLDVELVVVEVEEELDRRRDEDEVGEDDAGHEQDRHHQEDRQDDLPLARGQCREDEGVGLVEDDRQGDEDGAVEDEGQRRQECPEGEGERLDVVGQRPVGDVEQQVVLPEPDDRRRRARRRR